METIQSFGIQFITRQNKEIEKSLTIYARITVNGTRAEISLKQYISSGEWDSHKGMGKGNKTDIKELNQFLNRARTRISNIYRDILVDGELPTASIVKNHFLGIEEQGGTILASFEYHKKISESNLSVNTLKHYNTTEKYVKEFLMKKIHTSDAFLSKVNFKFITEFEYFLRRRIPTDHQKPMQNNGVMKHVERFRKVVNLAQKLDWINIDPFKNYQIKFKKVDRGYLEPDELQRIEETKFKLERLTFTKDLFIFSCYTGLAYIDTVQLKPDEIHLGTDGNQWIISNRQKTGSPLRIPILPKAWAMIDRYKNHPRSKFNGTIFPVISNQKLNSYLKEVADFCNITKNLTFHLARHTFATTVTLSNGVPIETVSKMLGHTSIKTTQIYARIVDAKISEDMEVLKSKLEENLESDQLATNELGVIAV
jgi:integrase